MEERKPDFLFFFLRGVVAEEKNVCFVSSDRDGSDLLFFVFCFPALPLEFAVSDNENRRGSGVEFCLEICPKAKTIGIRKVSVSGILLKDPARWVRPFYGTSSVTEGLAGEHSFAIGGSVLAGNLAA